jgi:hypothetical protein
MVLDDFSLFRFDGFRAADGDCDLNAHCSTFLGVNSTSS